MRRSPLADLPSRRGDDGGTPYRRSPRRSGIATEARVQRDREAPQHERYKQSGTRGLIELALQQSRVNGAEALSQDELSKAASRFGAMMSQRTGDSAATVGYADLSIPSWHSPLAECFCLPGKWCRKSELAVELERRVATPTRGQIFRWDFGNLFCVGEV